MPDFSARRQRYGLLVTLLALGLGLSRVVADEGSPGEPSEVAAPAEPTVVAAQPVDPSTARETAAAVADRAAEVRADIEDLLDDAREGSDVMRVTCLEDKLAQAGAHQESIGARQGALDAAIQSGDTTATAHQNATLEAIGRALETLSQKAAQCVGEGDFEVPPAVAGGEGPEGLDDPDILPETPPPDVPYIPPPASGYL